MFNNEEDYQNYLCLLGHFVSIENDMNNIHKLIDDIKFHIKNSKDCVIDDGTKENLDQYDKFLDELKNSLSIDDQRIRILYASPQILKIHYEKDMDKPYWPDLKSALSSYLGKYVFNNTKAGQTTIRVVEQSEAGTEFKIMITDDYRTMDTRWIGVTALDQMLKEYKENDKE